MIDTLTTLNWLQDQRRYMSASPLAAQSVGLLRAMYARTLSDDGTDLCVRVIRAALAATSELEPTTAAPLAHRVVYGLVRRALWYTLLQLATQGGDGTDEPVLTETALAALIAIETQDPIAAPPSDRLNSLAALYLGFSWRVSTIELGVDVRTSGAAALVGGGAPEGGIAGGSGSVVREFATNVGDGTHTAYTITHGLNTQDVIAIVRQAAAPYAVVYPDVAIASDNTITLTFASPPTAAQYRVVVMA